MRKSAALFPIVFALGATIVAGPGAQAAPIAITACQTISQSRSYVVANNLFNGSFGATCLIIAANDVTIDLAGFSIVADSKERAGDSGNPAGTSAADSFWARRAERVDRRRGWRSWFR